MLGVRVSGLPSWLDASPLAALARRLLREATGQLEPLEPLTRARPAALRAGRRIAFWSLVAGVGTSTTAALVAHRSAAAGVAPLLVDLDRWAPSLALRAQIEAATVSDVLLQPGREAALVSRWSATPFLPGSAMLHASFDGDRIAQLVASAAGAAPAVLDLGAGADSLDPAVLASLDRLCVVVGARAAQLQAAFCAISLLSGAPCAIGVAVIGAAVEDGATIASRLGWPLLGVIPLDPYLAEDRFATRAPTLRAIDALIRALA